MISLHVCVRHKVFAFTMAVSLIHSTAITARFHDPVNRVYRFGGMWNGGME